MSETEVIKRTNILSRFEISELSNIKMPDETILGLVSGFHGASTATLCITSRRLLLIDKKFFRLNYEDVRFESISEVSFAQQFLLASVTFYFAGRMIQFRSWYRRELRLIAQLVQNEMSANRRYQDGLAKVLSSQQTQNTLRFPSHLPSSLHRVSKIGYTPFSIRQTNLAQADRWHRASNFIQSLPILQYHNTIS